MATRFGTSAAALFRHKGHLPRMPPTTRRSTQHITGDHAPQALTTAREPQLFPHITHVKKRAFLAGFVRTGSRTQAGHLAGMKDDRMHWYWLQHDPEYAEAFAQAEHMAGNLMEDRLYTLALKGTRNGVYHHGVRVGEEEVVYPTLILAALNGIKPERYKYRVDATHSASPAMQALLQQWQQLKAAPGQEPRALSSPRDYTDAEITPFPDVRRPGQPSEAETFAMLDRVNGRDIEGDADDGG